MLTKKIDLLPKGHNNRPGYSMKAKGLIFHTTNNWSASAGDEMHAEYMENQKTRVVSWHQTVDRDSSTLHVPYNENAWHAGDGGKGHYNRNWIGLEIACNSVRQGQKLDAATYNNAVQIAADIVEAHNFGWAQLQPHKIVKGKDCPHNTLFSHNQFKNDVFAEVAARKKGKTTTPKPVPAATTAGVHTVKKGDTLTEIAELYKTNVESLVRINGIKDAGVIQIGQLIKLSGAAIIAAPAKAPATKAPVKHNIPTSAVLPNSRGQKVIDLQEVLEDHAPKFNPGKIDGRYGPTTKDAVKRYQSYYGVKPYDGIAGAKTLASLKKTYK